MAGLRVFISSTCVDLDAYRYQLRSLLDRHGFEPIMSDHSEVLYDPSLHTHASCLRDVEGADMLVLLIGARFGGTAVPQALPLLDLDHAAKISTSTALLQEKNKISITQAEAVKASTLEKPIFTFVDSKVFADHHFYQANKANPALSGMKFPSIAKQETAASIFEFINYMSHRSVNNGITPFSSFGEIEGHLTKQWSMLFQRLLQEKRDRIWELKRSSDLVERFEELKVAVLQMVPQGQARDLARAITRYRSLSDFFYKMDDNELTARAVNSDVSFLELLQDAGVVDVVYDHHPDSPYLGILMTDDGGFIGCATYSDDEINDVDVLP